MYVGSEFGLEFVVFCLFGGVFGGNGNVDGWSCDGWSFDSWSLNGLSFDGLSLDGWSDDDWFCGVRGFWGCVGDRFRNRFFFFRF